MPRSLPPTGWLSAFEATARLGGVSRAAAELSLTQSAVSRQLLALEARLGISLFQRSRKRLTLSDAGATYLEGVRSGLALLETATASMVSSGGKGGVVSVATLPTFGARWLVPRLPSFKADNPDVLIRLVSRPVPFDFAFEPLDGAIHFGQADWPGATCRRLFSEEVVAVAVPGIAFGIETADDVTRAPLLEITSRPLAWREWFRAVGLPAARFTPAMQVDTFAMATEAVLAGLGVGLLPALFVEQALSSGQLKRILSTRVESSAAYYFVQPERRQTHPSVARFVEWIDAQASELPSSLGAGTTTQSVFGDAARELRPGVPGSN